MESAVSRELAKKVLSVVDQGLVRGMGVQEPGKFCVEAAVCYAMGLPHSDKPTCVGSAVREFKIRLNDSAWPSDKDRAAGMRKISIAQLGSDSIDQMQFANSVAFHCQRRILPIVLRHAASFKSKFSEGLENVAKELENVVDFESAKEITKRARAITNTADDYANVYSKAYAYAYTYDYANTNDYADADDYANVYAYSKDDAYGYGYGDAEGELNNKLLKLLAEIGVDALIECKSPGCEFLDLFD